MSTDAASLFNDALALPEPLRAELAAKLFESLDVPNLAAVDSGDWLKEVMAASDELHRGEADLVEGDVALEMIQAAIDRVAATKR